MRSKLQAENLITPAREREMATNHLARHHVAFHVLDKETGNIINYGQLQRHSKYANTWNRSYANKMGRLYQGVGTGDGGVEKRIKGTEIFHVVRFEYTPKDQFKEVFYTSVVCEVSPGEKDPNRTRIVICGTNVSYTGDVGTKTASLKLLKLMVNRNLSSTKCHTCLFQCWKILPRHATGPAGVCKNTTIKNTPRIHWRV